MLHNNTVPTIYQIKFSVIDRKLNEIKKTLSSFEEENCSNLPKIATEMNVVHAKALEALGVLEHTFFYFLEAEEFHFRVILLKEYSLKFKELLHIFQNRIHPKAREVILFHSSQTGGSVLAGVVKVSLARTIETIKSIIDHLAIREEEVVTNRRHEPIDTMELFSVASTERSTTRELDTLREDVKHISLTGNRPVRIPSRYIQYCIGKLRIRRNHSVTRIQNDIQKTRPHDSTSFMPAQNGSAYWFPLPKIKNSEWYSLDRRDNDPLLNIRFQVDEGPFDKAHLMVNCGSINTPAKAMEFAWAVNYACSVGMRKCVVNFRGERFWLHQLNSYSNEQELVDAENKISRIFIGILEKHFNNPRVAHINLSLNFASLLPWEDSRSRLMNLEGWAQIALWVLEDVKFIGRLIDDEKLKDLFTHLLEQSDPLEKSKTFIMHGKTNNSPRLSDWQNALKKRLTTCAALAFEIGTQLNFKKDGMNELEKIQLSKAKILLLCLAYSLAMQTGTQSDLRLRTLSRVTEIELHLLLDMMLECISTINCKSGLDRTGYIRACWDGLRTMWKEFKIEHRRAYRGSEELCEALAYEDLLMLILNQDEATKSLDTIHSHLMLDLPCVDDLEKLDTIEPANNFEQLFTGKITPRSDARTLFKAYRYQRLMLKHLFQVCMPLTFESSGTPGLKYGHGARGLAGFFPNPHPLSRMPNFVELEEDGDIKLIKLVDSGGILNDLGRQFTPAACQLIHIMAEFRDH